MEVCGMMYGVWGMGYEGMRIWGYRLWGMGHRGIREWGIWVWCMDVW